MLFAFLLFALPVYLIAQPNNIKFEHLTANQGLYPGVNAICQDSKGFMWFGTGNGLTKYDGYAFHVLEGEPKNPNSLRGHLIYAILKDRHNQIWIATVGGGLDRFDPIHERFTEFEHHAKDSTSLGHNDLYALFEDHSGRLWVGTHSGLDMFNPTTQSFTHFVPDDRDSIGSITNQVTAIYEISSAVGELWIGTWGGGLKRFDCATKTFEHYKHDPKKTNSLRNNSIRFIYELPGESNKLWIGTEGGGLNVLNVRNKQFSIYSHNPNDPHSLSNDLVRSMLRDRAGRVWVGTNGGGLNRFEPATGRFTHYRHDPKNPETLSNDQVVVIFEDESGVLWFGTRNGLNRFDPESERFHHYDHDPSNTKSLSDNFVYPIYEDRSGVLWVGTWGGGLNRLNKDKETFTHFTHNPRNPTSLKNNYVHALYEDRMRTLWVGNSQGMLHGFDRERGTFKRFKIVNHPQNEDANVIRAMLEDKNGTFWVGTTEGLNIFDRKTGTHTQITDGPFRRSGVSLNPVFALYEDRNGVLWIGTRDEGLIKREKGKFTTFNHDAANAQSLSNNTVASVYEDASGVLWISTGGGLNYFDRQKEEFTAFKMADGLPDNYVYGVLEDANGHLWMSTSFGLSKFNPKLKTFKNFEPRYGLQGLEFNSQAYCKSRTGMMYFGGINGVNSFYPDSIRDNGNVPPIVITSFRVFEKPVKLDSAVSETKMIRLSYEQNVFSFEFAALNFSNTDKNQYAYKLEAFDKDWVYSGTRRYVTYTNLDGGAYVFRVKGSNNDGVWNEVGTSIAVIITPPFWKTWWFSTFFWLTVAGSIGGTIRYVEMRKLKRRIVRLEQEHALERERLRISQDMHDEVGAGLSEIGILSEIAKKDIRNPEEAAIHMQKISETSREIIASISEIIWAINPKNDQLEDLAAYLRHYAARCFGTTSVKLQFDIPETIPAFHLTGEARRNIFLVMKETVHNIIKHSGATAVIFTLSFTQKHLEIVVQDNGKGFTSSDISRFGNGLHNMVKRMKDIGGMFETVSEPGKGTRTAISIEL